MYDFNIFLRSILIISPLACKIIQQVCFVFIAAIGELIVDWLYIIWQAS